jgi:preprotein translocase subunit SecY
MASAAEQLAANISLANFSKATDLKKRLWFTVGALIIFRCCPTSRCPASIPAR